MPVAAPGGTTSLPVVHRLIEAGALAGEDVAVATPPGCEPEGGIVGTAARRATAAGGMDASAGSSERIG